MISGRCIIDSKHRMRVHKSLINMGTFGFENIVNYVHRGFHLHPKPHIHVKNPLSRKVKDVQSTVVQIYVPFRAVLLWNLNYFGFALLHSVIGSNFSRYFVNQSEVKPKPSVARACTLCDLRENRLFGQFLSQVEGKKIIHFFAC